MGIGYGRSSRNNVLSLTIDVNNDRFNVNESDQAAGYTNGSLRHQFVEVWYQGVNLSRTNNQDESLMCLYEAATGTLTFDPPIDNGETITLVTTARAL